MKVNANQFLSHIKKASLDGKINELVLGDKGQFAVTDDARSLLSINEEGLVGYDLGVIGAYDLSLLSKSVSYAQSSIFKNQEIEGKVLGNRLVFEKEGNEVGFLLSDHKTVSSTVENAKQVLEKLRAKEAVVFDLQPEQVKSCLESIALFSAETVSFKIKAGKVLFCVGKENEHGCQVSVNSNALFTQDFVLQFKADLLASVYNSLETSSATKLELRPDFPAIFVSGSYTFVALPIKV